MPKTTRKKSANTKNKESNIAGGKQTEPLQLSIPKPEKYASLSVTEGSAPPVETFIYIHGIGNKPEESVLKCQWDHALYRTQLGDRSRMAYWVNRNYYPVPEKADCRTPDYVRSDDDEITTRTILALSRQDTGSPQVALNNEIEALAQTPEQKEWLHSLAHEIESVESSANVNAMLPMGSYTAKGPGLRFLTRATTRVFLRDVNDFVFNRERRDQMEQSLLSRMRSGGGPFVIIAHSQGSMIAYNVLRRLQASNCEVKLFLTIGSPLGLRAVQQIFREWTGQRKLPVPTCVKQWINVADRLDVVAADPNLENKFAITPYAIKDHVRAGLNADSPWHPHSGSGYLRSNTVQIVIRQVLGSGLGQPVAQTVIAKDLVTQLEGVADRERLPVLIQLASATSQANEQITVETVAEDLLIKIRSLVQSTGDKESAAEIERLKRFVAAKLTREEVETLRTLKPDLQFERVWRDAPKSALINESGSIIQARPANVAYGARGAEIGWAVLNTGIRSDHPQFIKYTNVKAQWDCTKVGPVVNLERARPKSIDQHGHGTHVAAIIAGELEVVDRQNTKHLFSGMAPETRIYSYKVLDNSGNGRDSWIIKALDHIADFNELHGRLVIAGVNLSLGGNFDPSVFGCGHTPLCQELRRLWRQGVLVVLAAGNEGYAVLQAASGEIPANMDISIGDPANLEEAIAVGSVHKLNPHTYGVSYFSSRGPTADGRRKPDVVAPGEKILSARHDFIGNQILDNLYVEMSGTSMAAPHVSGILASFLSLRREFIGYPDRVKSALTSNCIDLDRDPYVQGHGIPNLIKMLALN